MFFKIGPPKNMNPRDPWN